MKKFKLLLSGFLGAALLSNFLYAQTNTFPSSGNVGIGTTSPEAAIEINAVTSSFNGICGLYVRKDYNGPAAFITQQQLNETALKVQRTSDGGAIINALDPSNNSVFYVATNGRIGVSQANPSAALEIDAISSTYNGVHGLFVKKDYSGPAAFITQQQINETALKVQRTSEGGAIINALDPSSNSVLYVATDGRVGIGTSSPGEKFSVNGNISTKKLIVTQTGWSDYVFDKEYKLRSLSSLESFINQNGHLPEVPSAKEVEEKGISVGDNQALLLKKIEEMTLYIIEMYKENTEIKKEIKLLKQQIAKQ